MFKILIHSQIQGEMWLVKETRAEVDAFIESSQQSEHYGNSEECSFEVVPYKAPIEDISPRQIRLALLESGITESAVDGAISALSSPDKEKAFIAWKFSTSFVRDLPIIDLLGSSLGLTSEQLDSIWSLGKGL
jgi:hypothetical protein